MMRNSEFLIIVLIGLGSILASSGADAGEHCDNTIKCDSGLACYDNECYQPAKNVDEGWGNNCSATECCPGDGDLVCLNIVQLDLKKCGPRVTYWQWVTCGSGELHTPTPAEANWSLPANGIPALAGFPTIPGIPTYKLETGSSGTTITEVPASSGGASGTISIDLTSSGLNIEQTTSTGTIVTHITSTGIQQSTDTTTTTPTTTGGTSVTSPNSAGTIKTFGLLGLLGAVALSTLAARW